ncbi:hypothetical protein Taro_044640 [Colocasia esculenta]|uniref:Uncharacterized protein n=1 Tax=Colocasia esculenta TaxID=4460 RepID=A0A843X183_COLES|nr:hypothetical protein [Colocasia esculenta]
MADGAPTFVAAAGGAGDGDSTEAKAELAEGKAEPAAGTVGPTADDGAGVDHGGRRGPPATNLARIERSAQKQAISGTETAGWWEKYDAKGWTEKGAHKYGRLNEQSWWEKWGEHYDGRGSVLKWYSQMLFFCSIALQISGQINGQRQSLVLNGETSGKKDSLLELALVKGRHGMCLLLVTV